MWRTRALAPLLLLLALAPSALYIDHWTEYFTADRHVEEFTPHRKAGAHDHHQEVHNSHCHDSSDCAGTSLAIGLEGATLETKAGGADLPSVLVGEETGTLEEVRLAPPTDPPRA